LLFKHVACDNLYSGKNEFFLLSNKYIAMDFIACSQCFFKVF